MLINNLFGVVEQIDTAKFECGGSVYIERNISEEGKSTNIQMAISSMCFDNKIYDIINKTNADREDKDLNARTKDIENFLENKGTDILDIIVFPDGGFRNNNHIVMEENSIMYIVISPNIKLGFFINKAVAKAIIGGYENVSKTE
ncbi:MAG: hypothetical protein ACRC0G_06575 [Fusobacteriaceae bacterium]